MLPGGRSELALREARHLFQAHFTAKLGHRVNDDQAAHALLQLAHVGLFFFGDSTTERKFRQLLRFFAQLLAVDVTQTRNLGFQRFFLLLQLGIFVGGFNQGQVCLLVADSVQTIAQAFNFVFSTSFIG
jgi:hypothetical protein